MKLVFDLVSLGVNSGMISVAYFFKTSASNLIAVLTVGEEGFEVSTFLFASCIRLIMCILAVRVSSCSVFDFSISGMVTWNRGLSSAAWLEL